MVDEARFSEQDQPKGAEAAKDQPPIPEPVWTFRGYQLRAGEFNTAMVHYYRAEITRCNVWRQRLDMTTNWAVISTGAAITIAFAETGFHGVIILNTLLITLFLMIEARRYRYYELWSYRARLMETDFFAAMLVPPFHPAPDWAESLAENLLHPDFSISMWEAVGRRFRRNYLWIYLILGLAWFARTALLPTPARTASEFYERAAVGGIPGDVMLFVGILFYACLIGFGLLTSTLHQATGEVLPRFADIEMRGVPTANGAVSDENDRHPWFRRARRRRQLMAMIITNKPKEVSRSVMDEMMRGVTSLHATGMYTGTQRAVLMCALTITEVAQLKALVYKSDPDAFVIVTPAQEVLGKGFMPLQPEKNRG